MDSPALKALNIHTLLWTLGKRTPQYKNSSTFTSPNSVQLVQTNDKPGPVMFVNSKHLAICLVIPQGRGKT